MNNSSLHRSMIAENSKTLFDPGFTYLNNSNRFSEEDNRFRTFIENLPVLFYAVQVVPPFTPLYVSPSFSRFGFDMERWLNDPDIWLKIIHPDDREWVFNQTISSSLTGEEVDYEYRIISASGELHWVRDRGCLIRDENDEVIYREGIMLDITDRKEAEQALKNSELRYRSLFEKANDIIYVHDLKGNYLDVNLAGEKIFGYSRNEVMSMNMKDVVVPDQLSVVMNHLELKLTDENKQTVYEVDCLRKDGSIVTLEINSTTIIDEKGNPIAVQGVARDITERKVSEDAVRESEEKYRDLFENANDIIYTQDLKGNFTSLNRTGELVTGYTREEALKMNFSQIIAPESLELAQEMVSAKLQDSGQSTYVLDMMAKDGRRLTLELSVRIIRNNKIPIGLQGIARDITERKRTEEQLFQSERRFRQLGEGIFHQVWTADVSGKLDYVNNRTLQYFDVPANEVLDNNWLDFLHPEDRLETMKKWADSIETGQFYETEFRLRRHDGEYRWHKVRGIAGLDADGKIVKWYGTNTDIDDQKQTEAKLNHIAKHDVLTGLPNRAEFMKHLHSAVNNLQAFPSTSFAVLFLDLDRFKVINDSLGHLVGDKLLRSIGERLNSIVRPSDIVARLGGDEFTILLNRTGSNEQVVAVAERVQKDLSRPFNVDGYEIVVSASIGITVADEILRQPEDFLRDADAAMYRAKETGKARFEMFNHEMLVQNMNQLRIETDLRHASEREEFRVVYQPIVNLSTGCVDEFEALIRWQHPEFGLLPPDKFISLAEESGTIIGMGQWLLKKVCCQLADWRAKTDRSISVSVNLSAKQLMHPTLTSEIKELLDKYDLRPDQLKLEVTESTVMEHSERSLAILEDLQRMGIHLSTDDFGTGYSSLSYLKEFPFDRIKIDRSFIDKMNKDKKNAAIVNAILTLGENIGLDVVAEGIEDQEHLDLLRKMNCKLGQGFLFSPPINAEKALGLISRSVPFQIEPEKTSLITEIEKECRSSDLHSVMVIAS